MRKFMSVFLVLIMLCFSACSTDTPSSSDATTTVVNTEQTTTDTAPTDTTPSFLSEIMKKPEEYPQLTKEEFMEATNNYLSTGEWILPAEKSCFSTSGINFNAYIVDDEYMFSINIKVNADGFVEYDFYLSHYSNGIVQDTEYNASNFNEFIK